MEKELNYTADEVMDLIKNQKDEGDESDLITDVTLGIEYGSDNGEGKTSAKKIKLSDIKIITKSEDEKRQNLIDMISSKPVTQFIATQSGYYGTIEPLTMRDFINIFNSNVESVEGKKMLISTIYKKIKETSCTPDTKMTFEEWKEYTTLGDLQSFYYALYCATFPGKGSFTYTCPKCGEINKVKINNEALIQSSDSEYINRVRELITKDSHDIETMKKYSLLNPETNDLFSAPSEKVFFELATPSLKTWLGIYEMINNKTLAAIGTEMLNEILYINKIYIKDQKSDELVEYSDKESILAILSSIDADDNFAIREEIYRRMEEQYVYYTIKDSKCPHCNHVIKEIPLNMEYLLFTLIFEKTF